MHYSPYDLQLGAEVQAKIDVDAAGNKFAFQYGDEPRDEMDEQTKYLIGGAIALGLIWLWRRK